MTAVSKSTQPAGLRVGLFMGIIQVAMYQLDTWTVVTLLEDFDFPVVSHLGWVAK